MTQDDDLFNKDGTINLQKVAERVAEKEGGKEQVSIAQIKEVISALQEDMAMFTDDLVIEAMRRF